uniref:Integrase catalytic domain-containing protein n=1 Tax=Oncorhynchus tshawytscha TaxID=74940 RepID=A0A8C8DF64_ONCTS
MFCSSWDTLVVVYDNAPQFACSEFKMFAEHYEFRHISSRLLYPKSNGKAEKGVQIVKRLLKKAAHSGTDPFLAVLSYRASPLECVRSPAEILMGRKLRSRLPSFCLNDCPSAVKDRALQLKSRHKLFYDKAARVLLSLAAQDVVRIQGPDSRDKKATRRSYTVRTENGAVYRRNRQSLLRTQDTFEDTQDTGIVSLDTTKNSMRTSGDVTEGTGSGTEEPDTVPQTLNRPAGLQKD